MRTAKERKMSKRLTTLLTAIAISGLIALSTTASFAGSVRDHRNTAGKTLIGSRGGYGCGDCVRLNNMPGGVAVTQGGKVVPTKVMPAPGGTYSRGGGGKR
jgi:hypothetical protein